MSSPNLSNSNKFNSSILDEIFSHSKEKIFLEPIDKYFEEELDNNDYKLEKIDFNDKDLDFQKLDDELCQSLNLDENDYSTEVESEESTYIQQPTFKKNKKLMINNFLVINKENINQAKINIINKYYWLAQNSSQFTQFNNKNYY